MKVPLMKGNIKGGHASTPFAIFPFTKLLVLSKGMTVFWFNFKDLT